jgi:hypothetical protein
MPTAWELEVDGVFATSLSFMTEECLLVLMDDYKALIMVAAQHGDLKACRWLERRVDAITEEYGRHQDQQVLPF